MSPGNLVHSFSAPVHDFATSWETIPEVVRMTADDDG